MTQWTLPKTLPSDLSSIEIIDLRGKLPVNPKGSWDDINAPRDLSKLTTIIVHHDGMSKASTAKYGDEEFIKRISTSHINSTKNRKDGDGGFPYHLFIRSGKIYICNDIYTFTYGVASNNSYTVHISVGGEYARTDALTDADRKALYAAYLLAKESMPSFKTDKGHGELQATSCPGFDMSKVRNDIFSIEMEMKQSVSPQKKEEIAYRMANHILYLQRMSKGIMSDNTSATEGQKKWALSELLKLEPEFRRLGFLK